MAATTKFQYKTDPITEVSLMFGIEFRTRNKNRAIVVSDSTGAEQRIPVEDIVCDICNALVQDHDPLAVANNNLHCWSCFQQWIWPYLTGKVKVG